MVCVSGRQTLSMPEVDGARLLVDSQEHMHELGRRALLPPLPEQCGLHGSLLPVLSKALALWGQRGMRRLVAIRLPASRPGYLRPQHGPAVAAQVARCPANKPFAEPRSMRTAGAQRTEESQQAHMLRIPGPQVAEPSLDAAADRRSRKAARKPCAFPAFAPDVVDTGCVDDRERSRTRVGRSAV
jgi:hypothetical protein